MGYWFENVKMDIQAERRKAEEACREAEERVRQAEKRAEKMVEELAEKKAEELAEKREKEAKIEMIVFLCQEYGDTKEAAIMKMMQKCGFSRAEAEKKADVYWKE